MDIGKVMSSAAQAYQAGKSTSSKAADKTKQADAKKTDWQEALTKTSGRPSVSETEYGKTIGEPKLSEKAQKYYEQLKSKFKNMDFVLVSEDQKGAAQANAASYGNASKQVVLINEEKLEQMANDESYRKKYEGIIAQGSQQLKQAAQQMSSFSTVAGFGINVDKNGNTDFFAVVKKSNKIQQEKLEEKRAAKKEEKKAEEKKAQKKHQKEKLEEKRAEAKEKDPLEDIYNPEEYEIIHSKSIEDLFTKVSDYNYAAISDNVRTEAETYVGGSIDYKG